jgi:glycosyltransferase involved in cell wall biosynthesis
MISSISVLTATKNCKLDLIKLKDSLFRQSYQYFHWIIIDACSTDGTAAYLKEISHPTINIISISEPDTGIYNAINKAVTLTRTSHYIVVGADDELYPAAIRLYIDAIDSCKEAIISSIVHTSDRFLCPRNGGNLFDGARLSAVSNHSVGVAIPVILHNTYGLYSEDYRLASDYHFLLRCILNNVSISKADFISGVYASYGRSSTSPYVVIIEQYIGLALESKTLAFLYSWMPITRLLLAFFKSQLALLSPRRSA